MIETTPAELEDFSGGITDFFIDAPANAYKQADNLLITPNQKLRTAPGSKLFSETTPQLPTGNKRISALIDFFDGVHDPLFAYSGSKLLVAETDTWEEVETANGDELTLVGDDESSLSWAKWNNHLIIANDAFMKPMKIFYDDVGDLRAVTAGLPRIGNDGSLFQFYVTKAVGSNSYIYAAHYVYTYSVGDVTYQDFGPVTYRQVEDAGVPSDDSFIIGNLEYLDGESYDSVNVEVWLYRTIANGDTLYLLEKMDNVEQGSTGYLPTYEDSVSDATLEGNIVLYTEGGAIENEPPPLAKYVHVANGACFYAHIKDHNSDAVYGYRILQSVVDDPDSVPAGNYLDLEENITGISSYGSRVVVFTRNSVYRIDGLYDELGAGGMAFEKISNTIGCVSHNSIVQIQNGIVFADEDGFAFTDGVDVIRINEQLSKRHKLITASEIQERRIYGTLDKENNRVYWAVQTVDSASSDCDQLFVLDLRYGIKANSTFTTMSGGEHRPQDFRPSAIVFKHKNMIRGDARGYVFKHDETYLTNPLVDTAKDPSEWDNVAIIYDYISIASSLGSKKFRKYTPKMIVSCENASNLSLQITSISDLKKERDLKPLRFRGNLVWGDPLFVWGNPAFRWGTLGFIEQQRHFQSNDLRCSYKQIRLTNAKTIVADSDGLAVGEVDATTKTITFPIAAGDEYQTKWPEDPLTYVIAFEGDDYVKEYPIISRDNDYTITLQDTGATLTDGPQKWVMRGYAKGEVLSLLHVTVLYSYLGQTQNRFSASQSGGNE